MLLKQEKKRKGVQKKKLIDTQCESNINTVTGELVSLSENIASGKSSQILFILLLLMMDEAYHQPFPNKLSNNLKLYSRSSFIRSILS